MSSDSIFLVKDKREISKYIDLISRNTRTLCLNIGAQYWKHIRQSIDFLYVLGKPINAYSLGSELIKGFLIGTLDEREGHAHILLVCAKPNVKGGGLRLIETCISDMISQNANTITLEALPQVINYYRNKFNFKLSRICSEDPEINRLGNLIAQRRFSTIDEARADSDMVRLLNQLIEAGLSSDPKCLEMYANKDDDYLAQCSSSGYWMTLCIDRPKKRTNHRLAI